MVDHALMTLSPRTAAARERARYQARILSEFMGRKYEGASRGSRTANWFAPSSSANTEIGTALDVLRSRSRDLVRNNTYADSAISTLVSNIVGTGIIPQAKGKQKKSAERIVDLWREWGESLLCDADGMNNFYGLQSLMVRSEMEGGEVLIRRRRRRAEDDLPVPLQLQVLEADYIDTEKNGQIDGGVIVQGVEFNLLGQRVAYWLFDQHPGDRGLFAGRSFTSKRVPASEVLPLFEVLRAGQVRGVPRGVSAFVRIKDFDAYEDAQLVRQKIASCFTAFIRDIEAGDGVASDEDDDPAIGPGLIANLPSGKTIEFSNPPGVDGFGEYSTTVLRAIARAYGVTYEAMTGDYSNVNFSSGRMGWIEMNRGIEQYRWLTFIPRVCIPIWGWFLEAAAMKGYRTDGIYAVWTPPKREMIDPTKEVSATRDAVRSGLKTLSEAIREQGFDPDEQFNEIAQERKLLKELGIVLDTDPGTKSADPMAKASPDPAANEEEETKK